MVRSRRPVEAEGARIRRPAGVAVAGVAGSSRLQEARAEVEADRLLEAAEAAASPTFIFSLRGARCDGTKLVTTDDPRLNRERIGQREDDADSARDDSQGPKETGGDQHKARDQGVGD